MAFSLNYGVQRVASQVIFDKEISMYYFMIEATPAPDNTEEQDVGGAYVNCWVNFGLEDGAEVLAFHYIQEAGWVPGTIHERKQVSKDLYQSDPEYLPYYLEAEADGVSLVFHIWGADAEDADVEYPEPE